MKTKSTFIGAALAASILFSTGAHAATELKITISGAGDPTTAFLVSANPTPSGYALGSDFALGPLTQITNGALVKDFYYFYSTAAGGAFNDNSYYNDYGAQLYSGPESSPTFILGSTSAYNYASGNTDTIRITSVPEASTWVLMLAGFAALGFAGYRRNKGVALAA
jgi:hypothetical protein